MRSRSSSRRLAGLVTVLGALAALGMLVGCSDASFYVRVRPDHGKEPSRSYLVVVSREPPPRGALLVGEMAFFKDFDELPAALAGIRDRARRMGGDLVASLRCRPERRHYETRRHDFVMSEPPVPGERLHCYAKVYRVP